VRIVVFGSLNVDTILDVDHHPAWGETILARASSSALGGKGANQAVAAHRLGGDVVFVGCVGTDAGGTYLRQALVEDGVYVQVRQDPATPSGNAMILRDPNGENLIVVAAGANASVSADQLSAPLEAGPSILVLQLEIPVQEATRAAQAARASGRQVILNAAPSAALPRELLEATDVLIVNELEAGDLVGRPIATANDALRAADELIAQGPRMIAVTLGARGAVLATHRQAWLGRPPAVDAVDTTAAGDAFVGALAVGIADGLAEPDALCFAVAAGSITVTRPGAQPSLPTMAEVERLQVEVSLEELLVREV